jgi:sugar lactone lactonase YvrE
MIYDDTPCQLGEGAFWHPERRAFYWCDILGKRLHTKGQYWQFDTYVSAMGWVDQRQIILASARALHLFDLDTGQSQDLIALEADNPATRSNDGRADPQGGFWIGTMGINAQPRAGAIYRYYRGALRRLFSDITISNAICFAPDGAFAYFTDTPSQMILRVALDGEGWPDGAPQLHIDLRGSDLNPDGAVVDAQGNLWCAHWGAGCVAGYDPAGQPLARFDFAARQISCPAFGGDDLRTLFCTSAAVGLDGVADGKTYCTPTQYTGQAEHRVIL